MGGVDYGYSYVWEYVVRGEHAADFLRTYGPDGDWVRLFRRAPGYVSTELLRDRVRPGRFVTVDRWRSKEDWEAFRSAFGAEYEAIDARCEGWTAHEAELGCFEPAE
ncbi:MAG: antibiotic biosynthesis monooxygenase [Deltaproteobacteria bacterium]|nr:antibiotic biosynthesis monooxygenase [Deltaproteobacteria bacterium]